MSNVKKATNAVTPEFLDYMGHEIRTPLNAVIGLSNILAKLELTPKQVEITQTLNSSAHSLQELISNLFDILKVENKTLRLEKEPLTLDHVIGEVVRSFEAMATQKGLAIEYIPCPLGQTVLKGDAPRIKQILRHLVDNSIKFTQQGRIQVTLSETAGEEADHTWAHIAVTDTGIGIPANKQSAIFEPSLAPQLSAERIHGGSGIGLGLSKGIAELMNGTISVDSAPGKGSCFTLHLPFVIEAKKAEPVTTTATTDKLVLAVENDDVKPLVLLVEDYAPNVMVAELVLNHNGFNVEVAANGEEALKRVRERHEHYAAVLMDVLMPEMDGFEVTSLIRKEESELNLPRIPIIAMTANSLLGDRERCIQAGMDEYIAKPFEPEYLCTLIRRLSNKGAKAA